MKQLCSKLWPVLMALALLMSFGTSVRADGDSVSYSIDVEVNGETIISITPGSGSPAYPNPTMTVVDSAALVFSFNAPGDYSYTVKQAGTDPSIIYDDTEYLIQFHIELNAGGTLEGTVSLSKTGSSFKEVKIQFGNSKVEEETTTIIRTIIYKEFDENGKEIFIRVEQPVVIKRTKTTDPDGNVSFGPWEMVGGGAPAVDSPPYPGWTPDKDQVPTWDVDLNDPKDETVYVFYKPDPTTETKTITRTITYTEYTPDGKEVSVTVVQTVTLTRTVIQNPDGSYTYGEWEISGGDTAAISSPPYEGWTPNLSQVGRWEIDLKDPKSVVIHVVYHPTGSRPDTGDDFWTGWFVIFGIAAAGLAGLLVFAGKKNSKDSREDQ